MMDTGIDFCPADGSTTTLSPRRFCCYHHWYVIRNMEARDLNCQFRNDYLISCAAKCGLSRKLKGSKFFHHFVTNTDIADGSSFIKDGAVFKQVLQSAWAASPRPDTNKALLWPCNSTSSQTPSFAMVDQEQELYFDWEKICLYTTNRPLADDKRGIAKASSNGQVHHRKVEPVGLLALIGQQFQFVGNNDSQQRIRNRSSPLDVLLNAA